jgi:hypothetical protein
MPTPYISGLERRGARTSRASQSTLSRRTDLSRGPGEESRSIGTVRSAGLDRKVRLVRVKREPTKERGHAGKRIRKPKKEAAARRP